VGRHKPGATIPILFVRRGGERVTGTITLDEDPRIEIVPLEATGATPSAAQQAFRDAWLRPQ
jgi:hypothetical protein